MNTEYVEPNRGRMLRRLVLLAVLIYCYVNIDAYWQRLMGFVKALPPCEQIPWLRTIAIAMVVLLMLGPVLVAWEGYRILQFRQWPLPGAFVWRRTKIKRDRWVPVRAYAQFAAALAVAVGIVYLVHLMWPFIRPAFVAWPECNGA